MKKFLLRTLAFSCLMVIVDFLAGKILIHLAPPIKGGEIGLNEFIRNECQADVLVFGSSRAAHHYVSDIIADSLNMSCFNCGQDGNGIRLATGYLKMILERYCPKLVIYDVTDWLDLYQEAELDGAYLIQLRPYYMEDKEITRYLNRMTDWQEKICLHSSLYRQNQLLVRCLNNLFKPDIRLHGGYRPLYGIQKQLPAEEPDKKRIPDTLNRALLTEFLDELQAHNIPVLLFVSPIMYGPEHPSYYSPLIRLARQKDIPCHICLHLSSVYAQPQYFQDNLHLNHTGAIRYTQHIIPLLRNALLHRPDTFPIR